MQASGADALPRRRFASPASLGLVALACRSRRTARVRIRERARSTIVGARRSACSRSKSAVELRARESFDIHVRVAREVLAERAVALPGTHRVALDPERTPACRARPHSTSASEDAPPRSRARPRDRGSASCARGRRRGRRRRPRARSSMKASVVVASGAIMRSADECEMSRSCQRRDVLERRDARRANHAGEAAEVLRSGSGCACGASRSSPSARTVKASSASPTSSAASDARSCASRSMPGGHEAPSRRRARRGDRAGRPACSPSPAERPSAPSALAPRSPARGARRCRRRRRSCRSAICVTRVREALAAARHLGVVAGEDDAERDGLGEDAVAAADHRRLGVSRVRAWRALRGARRARVSIASVASRSWIANDVSSTSLDVIPRWKPARPPRRAPRRA